MEGIFGARAAGFGSSAPVTFMYRLADDVAYAHMLGRWVQTQSDNRISSNPGPVGAADVRSAVKGGKLLTFADDWGDDEYHTVRQFAVAVEKVDIAGLMTQEPVVVVAACVGHSLPDGPTYYSTDRGSLYPGGVVRSPVQHAFRDRTPALKKFDAVVTSWEEQPEYEVTRFVISPETSWDVSTTPLELIRSHYALAIERREKEIEEALKQPLHIMNDDMFAQMFQKKMVEGS